MGAGKLSNGFIRTGTRIQLYLQCFVQNIVLHEENYFETNTVGLKIVVLILVPREPPTTVGVDRNTGSWESCSPILTSSHQPTQSKD